MAYLLKINTTCQWRGELGSHCPTRATQTLFDWRNERKAQYCDRHAKLALKERQEWENNNRDLR